MTEDEIKELQDENIALRLEIGHLRGIYSNLICHGGYTGNPLLPKIREMILAIDSKLKAAL